MNTISIITAVALIAVALLTFGCRKTPEVSSADDAIPVAPPQNADEFNALFDGACTRLKPLVALGGYSPSPLSERDSRKVRTCIADLHACLEFANDHWQSMVFLAKAHQALGEHQKSLDWLRRAMAIEPNSHVLPKEASLEAVHLRDIKAAISYSAEAMRLKPNDPELMGNHAMNLLIDSQDREAEATIQDALRLAPQDSINQRIAEIIADVIAGRKERPTCESVMQ